MRLGARTVLSGRRVAYLVVLVVLMVFAGSLVRNLVDLLGVGGREEEAEAEVVELEEEHEELRRMVERASGGEFEERQIREKLGLVKPGEAVVIIPEDLREVEVKEAEVVEEEGANWEKWFQLFL